jgi:hypothetical protein
MGWARTLLLGDIGNRMDIADTERDVADVRRLLRDRQQYDASQDEVIRRLRTENEQLEMGFAVLVKTLEGKGVLSKYEVERLVRLVEDDEASGGASGDAP